jgi:predicted transcriptional regulator
MTNDEYSRLLKKLGFNYASFATFCGCNRSTIIRHSQGKIDPIPQVYKNVLTWMEEGKLDNPND